MSRINDGGAAFPRPASEYTQKGTLRDGNDAIDAQDGMSLRDYFAAKAMQILLGVDSDTLGDDLNINVVARDAYGVADAMLKARLA